MDAPCDGLIFSSLHDSSRDSDRGKGDTAILLLLSPLVRDDDAFPSKPFIPLSTIH